MKSTSFSQPTKTEAKKRYNLYLQIQMKGKEQFNQRTMFSQSLVHIKAI